LRKKQKKSEMIDENTLIINSISKTYKIKELFKIRYKKAIENISFDVKKGEILGILGLNGAGKTTIIKIICGITKPDCGSIEIMGRGIRYGDIDYKKKIGYLPEFPYFYPYLTGLETLKFYAGLSLSSFDMNKIDKILFLVGLEKYKNDKVKNYSKGMMQRLAIATTLIHNPDFLIYDEPTSGLDPLSIRDIRNILLSLKNESKTILLASHSISEVEKICDRVMILREGKINKIIKKNEWIGDNLEEIFIKYAL
jgi:ABC-2 type transport system ATP-binding protein